MRKLLCAGFQRVRLAAAVLCAVGIVAGLNPILAAPNRQGTSAKLTVLPTPVPFNSTYVISGTGFKAGGSLTVTLARHCDDGITYAETVWMGMADASGSFAFARGTQWCTGTYVATAYQGRRGSSASVSFPVQ